MSRFLSERMRAFAAYTPGEQPKVTGALIKLNTNESPYPPPPSVARAMTPDAIARLRLYSDLAAADLVSALSEDLGVDRNQIAVGNGSDEVIYFAMIAFGGSGAAFADITYGFYPVWSKLIGIEEQVIPLKADFTLDPADYASLGKMILIANPNAPTGIALSPSDIERILRANPDQVVLVDEAYVDFGGESCVPLAARYDNLLVCRTFSKSRQMAGARLGFLVGSPALIADVEKVRYSVNPYNVNSLTQIAGAASVRDKPYFERTRQSIIATREWTSSALNKLGFAVLPSSANFLFAKAPNLGGQAYMQALRRHNILVRWFDADRIRDYVRITIGTDEQMRLLIEYTQRIIGGTDA